MDDDQDVAALDEALRHCRAGLKALEAARRSLEGGTVYLPYFQLGGVELAHAIEASMKVALRRGHPASQNRKTATS